MLLMMKLFATGPTAFESVAATAWVNDRVVRWLGQTVAGLTDTDPVLVVPTGVVLAGGTWVGQRHSVTTDLARECVVARTISVHWCAVSSKKIPSWPFSSQRLFHATDELVYASKSRAWLLQ